MTELRLKRSLRLHLLGQGPTDLLHLGSWFFPKVWPNTIVNIYSKHKLHTHTLDCSCDFLPDLLFLTPFNPTFLFCQTAQCDSFNSGQPKTWINYGRMTIVFSCHVYLHHIVCSLKWAIQARFMKTRLHVTCTLHFTLLYFALFSLFDRNHIQSQH